MSGVELNTTPVVNSANQPCLRSESRLGIMDTYSYPAFASIRHICVEQQVAMLVVANYLQMLDELPLEGCVDSGQRKLT